MEGTTTTTERGWSKSLEHHHNRRQRTLRDVSGWNAWCASCKKGAATKCQVLFTSIYPLLLLSRTYFTYFLDKCYHLCRSSDSDVNTWWIKAKMLISCQTFIFWYQWLQSCPQTSRLLPSKDLTLLINRSSLCLWETCPLPHVFERLQKIRPANSFVFFPPKRQDVGDSPLPLGRQNFLVHNFGQKHPFPTCPPCGWLLQAFAHNSSVCSARWPRRTPECLWKYRSTHICQNTFVQTKCGLLSQYSQ